MYLIKLTKTIGIMFLIVLITTFLVSLLHYIGLPKLIVTILKILIVIGTLFYGGFYMAKLSKTKGYLEGIKIGLVIILLFFLISWLGLNYNFSIKTSIFYILMLISSTLGGMIGINKNKIDENA